MRHTRDVFLRPEVDLYGQKIPLFPCNQSVSVGHAGVSDTSVAGAPDWGQMGWWNMSTQLGGAGCTSGKQRGNF